MSTNKLDCSIFLINRLSDCTRDTSYIYGCIKNLSYDDLEYLSTLKRYNLIEISNLSDKSSIDFIKIGNYLNETISIEFKIGDVNTYYETIEEFISKNRFQINQQDYFIKELDFRVNSSKNEFIDKFNTNLMLIKFLKTICDNEKTLGNHLNLFFYKAGSGIELEMKYTYDNINKINFNIHENFIDIFSEPINGSDRKQLFINELINFLNKNGNSFEKLLDGWETLLLNYEKSYSLFLSGFSFDKIKNSSTEYFQNIIDRIYDSIAKASNYIFGVPIGFILLLNNFDFSGIQIAKNLFILLLGVIFFIMIWYILFKNIRQSINAIETDLLKFSDKIINVSELSLIHKELLDFKDNDLQKQYDKILLVKILTVLIFAIFCLAYTYIFINTSVFLI